MKISLNEQYAYDILSKEDTDRFIAASEPLIGRVMSGKIGLPGLLGWFRVDEHAGPDMLQRICEKASEIRKNAEAFVIVGVGGSNRAAQSFIEGLPLTGGPEIYYAGNNMSPSSISALLRKLEGKSVYANVIAKDFNTIEPGVAFRVLRDYLGVRFKGDWKKRIILTGSRGTGQLFDLACEHGFDFFDFPKNVGGRFSAFTAVGLLPMAVAGADIVRIAACASACEVYLAQSPYMDNIAVRYAAIRHLLAKKGFMVENLAYFEPCLEYLGRWWLQLHGETEGKCEDAILPMTTSFSEDLHAIGQYIQEGRRFIFETLLDIINSSPLAIPSDSIEDGFAYLNGKPYDSMNTAVISATAKAHSEDGIPVLMLRASRADEEFFAEFMYFNMLSAYLSCAFLGIEPFDQNGVEAYKKNLYRGLGKQQPAMIE